MTPYNVYLYQQNYKIEKSSKELKKEEKKARKLAIKISKEKGEHATPLFIG